MKATISNLVCVECGWTMYSGDYKTSPIMCDNKECENWKIKFKRPIFELEKWKEA